MSLNDQLLIMFALIRYHNIVSVSFLSRKLWNTVILPNFETIKYIHRNCSRRYIDRMKTKKSLNK